MKLILPASLLAHWQGLKPNERLALAAGGVVLLVALYLALLVPMQNEVELMRAAVPREQAQLALMRVQAREAVRLKAGGRQATGAGNLLSRLEQSASSRGLRQNLTRMEPEGADGARLTLDGVDFNALAGWLAELQNTGGVRIEKATLEAQPEVGMVNARLVVRGPGA